MSNSNAPARVVGGYVSPYVRKLLLLLELKGIAYEIDPIVPFFGDDRFGEISPLRRIPVYIDDLVTLSDSSVICQYIEDRYPQPSYYPSDIAARARARWLEEFADTRMGDVIIWQLFNQKIIKPFVWKVATDEAVVARTLTTDLPAVLDYLEREAPAQEYFCGALSIADLAVSAFFRNAAFAGYSIDAQRWPRIAGLVERVLELPAARKLAGFEELLMQTSPRRQREVLLAAGAPISVATYGTGTARAGVMRNGE